MAKTRIKLTEEEFKSVDAEFAQLLEKAQNNNFKKRTSDIQELLTNNKDGIKNCIKIGMSINAIANALSGNSKQIKIYPNQLKAFCIKNKIIKSEPLKHKLSKKQLDSHNEETEEQNTVKSPTPSVF